MDIVYKEGYDAYYAKIPKDNCPYKDCNLAWNAIMNWEMGWDCGKILDNK